jgi:hypothetical protein
MAVLMAVLEREADASDGVLVGTARRRAADANLHREYGIGYKPSAIRHRPSAQTANPRGRFSWREKHPDGSADG